MWIDFGADISPYIWQPRLHGGDAVINTVGILTEHGAQTFARIHVAAPRALFQACAHAGVHRMVQVSALGADSTASTAFHRSKRAADEALHALLPTRLMVLVAGLPLDTLWLAWTIGLYALAVARLLPVVVLQMRTRDLEAAAAEQKQPLPADYWRAFSLWGGVGHSGVLRLRGSVLPHGGQGAAVEAGIHIPAIPAAPCLRASR